MIKKLSSRIVYENAWMKVREDEVEFSDGAHGIYGVVDKPDAVLAIPKLDADTYVLVKPYRYTIGKGYWEFPHGAVEQQEAEHIKAARRELQEETGYTAQTMKLVARIHVAYGYANQLAHLFLAEGLTAGNSNPDSGEKDMEIKTFSASEIDSMIITGEITDAQSIAAWSLLKLKKDYV